MTGHRRVGLARSLSFAALAAAFTFGALPEFESADAQVRYGVYWLTQPHQTTRVGRVWCNPDRTAEYWAYVQGEYRWADVGNGPSQRWVLEAEFAGESSYPSFAAFRDATRALPEFQGKTLVFQDHSVVETVVQN